MSVFYIPCLKKGLGRRRDTDSVDYFFKSTIITITDQCFFQITPEEEAEGTRSSEHLPKPTRTRHTQSRPPTSQPRETRNSEKDASRRSSRKKSHTSSSNFELTIDNGHINLFHQGKELIDLSNSEKQVVYHSVTLKLEDSSLKIVNSSGYTQREYDGVTNLITFDGRHMSEHKRAMVRVQVPKGQLYVSQDKAFYSSSEQLNMLLNDQLARVIPRQSDTMLMFQALPGGDLMLLINGEPVVTLSGAAVMEVPVSNYIQYTNGTIYVRNAIKDVDLEDRVYSKVNQFCVLNGYHPGLDKYNKSLPQQHISGGGRLYVHTKSSEAFYSRNRQINTAIDEHISRIAESPKDLVFAIRFENTLSNQSDTNPEIVLLVNGDEIFHFDPSDTEDQSLTLRHSLKYTNKTLFILKGSHGVAGAFIDVKELLVFDGFKISAYQGSATAPFAGGGQIFNSGSKALYSQNVELNDQIGEALIAVEGNFETAAHNYSVSESNTSTTKAPYSQSLITSTESNDHSIHTEDPQLVHDSSRTANSETSISTNPKTHKTIKDESPRIIKSKEGSKADSPHSR